ncbi:MAG: hypothetical protein IPK70_08220 [Flavobacteriales bacterium]|nr:hypothetical protein [Flavobacteriales bacterium]
MLALLLAATSLVTPYSELKASIESKRSAFNDEYSTTDSLGKARVVDNARSYLFDRITLDILPAWHGTKWDFNGTTRTPRQGTIACGYFVNTVLQDAGFRLPRIKWSQMAAEPITVKTCHVIKRFRNRPVGEVEAWLRSQGDGLYKIGLDNHVGFIVVRDGQARFIHSNYYQREVGVMSEPLEGNNPLAHSRYRIVGRLLGDAMMIAWITGADLTTLP